MIDQFFRGMDLAGKWIFALAWLGFLLVLLFYTVLAVVCLAGEWFTRCRKVVRKIHGLPLG